MLLNILTGIGLFVVAFLALFGLVGVIVVMKCLLEEIDDFDNR